MSAFSRCVLAFGRGTAASLAKRGKVDLSRLPPWRRWPKTGIQRIKHWKLPVVNPSIDVFDCEDPTVLADSVCEVVPWKRTWDDHEWLHQLCGKVRKLLPQMNTRDVVRVILAFGELYTKRKPTSLLFYDNETYALLFQALSAEDTTAKTLLPLLRVYRRMGVQNEEFVRDCAARVVAGELELEPGALAELVRLHSHFRILVPELLDFAAEVLDLRFAYFSEDEIGELARAFRKLRYHNQLFFDVLHRELPYRLHEYAWWNLIDIAELYLDLQVQDPDVVQRIGNETFKLVFSMRSSYAAKALKVLAMLEVGDKRTFRLLVRQLPRSVPRLSTHVAAESVIACQMVNVDPRELYHKLPGSRIYSTLVTQVLSDVGSLSAKMTCDVLASLAHAGHRQPELLHAIEGAVAVRPFKYHAEHLASLLRDFAVLRHKSPSLRRLLTERHEELSSCTPSGLCSLYAALAGHPRPVDLDLAQEEELLSTAAQLLIKPGVYRLPERPGVFRGKDDFWWQQIRQRHFRHRRKSAAAGLPATGPAVAAPESNSESAVSHISRQECLQLVKGCASLARRDEALLEGVTSWLCAGRNHAELEPHEVAALLAAFAELGYSNPLMRAAMERATLLAAPRLAPRDCVPALRGALALGLPPQGAAVRAILRRCTGELALVPPEHEGELRELSVKVQGAAERELLAQLEDSPRRQSPARMPLELHLFGEAVRSRLGTPERLVVVS